jgi:hypothetical protein
MLCCAVPVRLVNSSPDAELPVQQQHTAEAIAEIQRGEIQRLQADLEVVRKENYALRALHSSSVSLTHSALHSQTQHESIHPATAQRSRSPSPHNLLCQSYRRSLRMRAAAAPMPSAIPSVRTPVNGTQRDALMAFFTNTAIQSGCPWSNATGWGSDSTVCEW